MLIIIGVWLALAGAVAALAGLSGQRRARRLRRVGATAWAVAVPAPAPAGDNSDGGARRTLIQYALPDGRVVEQASPEWGGRGEPLRPGQKVLVWYDPADPRDVLAYGREGRLADRAFVAVGLLMVVVGVSIAGFIG